jgi:hypothetical protein
MSAKMFDWHSFGVKRSGGRHEHYRPYGLVEQNSVTKKEIDSLFKVLID